MNQKVHIAKKEQIRTCLHGVKILKRQSFQNQIGLMQKVIHLFIKENLFRDGEIMNCNTTE